jgi:hypothetical protein
MGLSNQLLKGEQMRNTHIFVAIFAGFVSLSSSLTSSGAILDFEDGTDDVAVGSFYASQGIEFSNTQWGDENVTLPGMSGELFIANITGAQYEPKLPNQIIATFPGLAAGSVSIDAIDYGDDGVRIDAYDSITGGTLIDFDSAVSDESGQFITLSVTGSSIRRIEIYQYQNTNVGDGIVFDDLNFTLVPEPTSLGLFALAGTLLRRNRSR